LEDDPGRGWQKASQRFLQTPETLMLVRREADGLEAIGHPPRPSGPTVVSRRQLIGGKKL
jgi:hypothetical protein